MSEKQFFFLRSVWHIFIRKVRSGREWWTHGRRKKLRPRAKGVRFTRQKGLNFGRDGELLDWRKFRVSPEVRWLCGDVYVCVWPFVCLCFCCVYFCVRIFLWFLMWCIHVFLRVFVYVNSLSLCVFFMFVYIVPAAPREATAMNTSPGASTRWNVTLVVYVCYCQVIGDFVDFVASHNPRLFYWWPFCLWLC